MFKVETHLHTASVSRCGKMSAEQIVDLYLQNGYDAICVTDHFFRGNCRINDEMPDAPFADRVHAFARGYREVKEAAGDRLKVFFGFEEGFLGTHLLVYGWDEDTLASYPEISGMKASEFIRFVKEHSGFVIQAHPYRPFGNKEGHHLYPEADAVEVLNASRADVENSLAESYAGAMGIPSTAGSDLHRRAQKRIAGVWFTHEIHTVEEFIEAIRAGEGKVFSQPNVTSVNDKYYVD